MVLGALGAGYVLVLWWEGRRGLTGGGAQDACPALAGGSLAAATWETLFGRAWRDLPVPNAQDRAGVEDAAVR